MPKNEQKPLINFFRGIKHSLTFIPFYSLAFISPEGHFFVKDLAAPDTLLPTTRWRVVDKTSGQPVGKITYEPCLSQGAASIQLPSDLAAKSPLTEYVVAISADARCSEGQEQVKLFDMELIEYFKKKAKYKQLSSTERCGLKTDVKKLDGSFIRQSFSIERPKEKVSLKLLSLTSADPTTPPAKGAYQVFSLSRCFTTDSDDRLLVLNVENGCQDCEDSGVRPPWEDYRLFSGNYVKSRMDNLLGMNAYKKKQYVTAARWFAEAVKKDPDYVVARVNLAGALARRGKDKLVIHQLKMALKTDQDYTLKKMKTDSDFSGIRKDPSFKALLP